MFKSTHTLIPSKHKQSAELWSYLYSKLNYHFYISKALAHLSHSFFFLYILLNSIFIYFLWYETFYILDGDEYCTTFLHLGVIISRTFSPTMSGSRRDCDNFQSSGRAEGTQLDGSMTSNGWKGMLRMHVLICSPSRSESLRTEYSFLSRTSRGISASKGKDKFFS